MIEHVWESADEFYHSDTRRIYQNEHAAMDYANSQLEGLTWYMIHEGWWRGVNAATGYSWSVVKFHLY